MTNKVRGVVFLVLTLSTAGLIIVRYHNDGSSVPGIAAESGDSTSSAPFPQPVVTIPFVTIPSSTRRRDSGDHSAFTKDTRVGWKSYRNVEFGFEIEYPDFLELTEMGGARKDQVDVSLTIVQFAPPVLPGESANPPTMGISVERAAGISIGSWIQSTEKNLREDEESTPDFKVVLLERTEVNGIDAFRIVTDTEMGRTESYTLFPSTWGPFIYELDVVDEGNSHLVPDPFKLLESMVQTYKFIK